MIMTKTEASQLKIVHLNPSPSEAKNKAEQWQIRRMSEAEKLAATCMFCKTVYRNASPAYRCEHWHVP